MMFLLSFSSSDPSKILELEVEEVSECKYHFNVPSDGNQVLLRLAEVCFIFFSD